MTGGGAAVLLAHYNGGNGFDVLGAPGVTVVLLRLLLLLLLLLMMMLSFSVCIIRDSFPLDLLLLGSGLGRGSCL